MSRFFGYWLVLLAVLVVATFATAFVGFHHVDLTVDNIFSLLLVPSCQAAIAAWVVRPPDGRAIRRTVAAIAAHPLTAPVLLIDAAMLAVGWVLRTHDIWGFGGLAVLQTTWIGTKAMASATFLLAAALRPGAPAISPRPSSSVRLWLLLYGLGIGALGTTAFHPWLRELPAHLFGEWPILAGWIAVHGPLAVVLVATTLFTAHVLARTCVTSAALLEAATAVGFLTMLAIVLNGFLRESTPEGWLSTIRCSGSITVSLLLLGSLLHAVPADSRATTWVASEGH